jgi:hypothetical protein
VRLIFRSKSSLTGHENVKIVYDKQLLKTTSSQNLPHRSPKLRQGKNSDLKVSKHSLSLKKKTHNNFTMCVCIYASTRLLCIYISFVITTDFISAPFCIWNNRANKREREAERIYDLFLCVRVYGNSRFGHTQIWFCSIALWSNFIRVLIATADFASASEIALNWILFLL